MWHYYYNVWGRISCCVIRQNRVSRRKPLLELRYSHSRNRGAAAGLALHHRPVPAQGWSSERVGTEQKTRRRIKLCSALVNLTLFSDRILYRTLPTLNKEQNNSDCVSPLTCGRLHSALTTIRSSSSLSKIGKRNSICLHIVLIYPDSMRKNML